MDIDKLNAVLATAIGGYISKSLYLLGKSFFLWIKKTYPEEIFLIENLNIPNYYLRLSHNKYSINSKGNTNGEKIFLKFFASTLIISSLVWMYFIISLLIKNPIVSVEYNAHNDISNFWVNQDHATNPPQQERWYLDKEICLSPKYLKDVTQINTATKNEVCSFFLDSIKNNTIDRIVTKNIYGIMVLFPIVLFAGLFILSLGIGIYIDIYIRKEIVKYRDNEILKCKQYIT